MGKSTRTVIEIMKGTTIAAGWTEFFALPVVAITLGAALVGASLSPIANFAGRGLWNDEDAAAYVRISGEFHRSLNQSPELAGLTEAERNAQREHLQSEFDALHDKLQYAREQPKLWSRYLLWSGLLLTVLGGLGYRRRGSETD